jgi:hypothetical protein
MNPAQTKPKQIACRPEAVLLQMFTVNQAGGLVTNREHIEGKVVLTVEWPDQQDERQP